MGSAYPVGKVIAFLLVAFAWVAVDQFTKGLFGGMPMGAYAGSALGGLVDFRLVHNTGAAWGLFAGNTDILGMFSIVVCAVLTLYFLWNARAVNIAQTFGIALIVAGGIGNAIDRFAQGYVTDFIALTFVDFPVFNVADIGVTCGVVILVFGLIIAWAADSNEG